MNNIVLATLLTFIFVASVHGQPVDIYISGNAGMAMMKDVEVTNDFFPGALVIPHDNALVFSGAIGLDVGMFRSEIEICRQKHDISDSFADVNIPGAIIAVGHFTETKITSKLLNAYVDIPFGASNLSAYLTGGAGFATVDINAPVHIQFGEGLVNTGVNKDTAFAFQLGTGLGYAITEQLTIDLRYRFYSIPKINTDENQEKANSKFNSHKIVTGLRFTF